MRCPYCHFLESKVMDSRLVEDSIAIRRRRECEQCGKRFTTYEHVKEIPLMVLKKDGRRERFDRNKILTGIIKACEKRPVSMEKMDHLVDSVERECRNRMQKEMKSRTVGQLIVDKLKALDKVAYVRFASVYKEFKDVNTFMEEIKKLR